VRTRLEEVHVVFNNNYGDQGQRNGKSLEKILESFAVQTDPVSVMGSR